MKNKGLYITIAAVAIAGVLVIGKYNGFVTAEQKVENKWSEVDNQLKRQADLIPNLVESVKGYAAHETDAIDSVTKARALMTGAQTPEDTMAAEQEMTGALSRLMVVVENYPDLKANENFIKLMDSLEGTQNRITVARKGYNDSVTTYNSSIKKFPGNVMAGMFGFDEKTRFEATEAEKETPKVDFGGTK